MKRSTLCSVALALALALVAVTVTVLAQTASGPVPASEDLARVRFIHASPDAAELDVLLNDTGLVTNSAFGEISAYTELAAGTYTVTLRLTDEATPLVTETVVVTETDYTLAAAGTLAADTTELELLRLMDDNTAPAPGMVRARFVHLVPDVPFPVSIAIDGDLLFEDIKYRDVTPYTTVDAGSHTLQLLVSGVEVATGTLTVSPNSVYSFFAVGLAYGTPEVAIVQVLDESYDHHIWLPLVARGG
ncbi:MAG: DUF4397 domain-containing protein [Chloroflexota bacterium]